MTTVLPFPNRRADNSPQPDIASVGVKHTAAGCEPGVDWFRLPRIRVLKCAIRAASIAGDICAAARFKAALRKAEAGLDVVR